MTSPNAVASSSTSPSTSAAPSANTSPSRFKTLRKLKSQWSYPGRARLDSTAFATSSPITHPSAFATNGEGEQDPYLHLPAWPDDGAARGNTDGDDGDPFSDRFMSEGEQRRVEDAYEWEVETASGSEVDQYSWVDPSVIGSDRLRATPSSSTIHAEASIPDLHAGETSNGVLEVPGAHSEQKPLPPRPSLAPHESYNLLIDFQSSTLDRNPTIRSRPSNNTSSIGHGGHHHGPEWHEMVDETFGNSLARKEQKRQGCWWELINAEREYVRDLKIICETFIEPLRTHQPPVLSPAERINPFIDQVFSEVQQIYHLHIQLLNRLMERQRDQWPLLTSATDLLLATALQATDPYEKYMKNYPFAEDRIRREKHQNPAFKGFLEERNTLELTHRRDISVLLSRPVTRLPRMKLVLEQILAWTPDDHPDRDEIPTLLQVLNDVIRSSQPGIESAEAKLRLWNMAEVLHLKRGEIIDLDINDSQRSLIHSSRVCRRIRNETNWHGWQDLKMYLMDNYFLLVEEAENGRHLVVKSRPLHLDFLTSVVADAVPERRWEGVSTYLSRTGTVRRQVNVNAPSNSRRAEPGVPPERIAWPFTVQFSAGPNSRTYTLCTSTDSARHVWKAKFEEAAAMRRIVLEGNRIFTFHTISSPPSIDRLVLTVDTFSWLGREAIAFATSNSVWIGWRRDSSTCRELLTIVNGPISALAIVPNFGLLLVLTPSGLLSYHLDELMATSDPSTWICQTRQHATTLGNPEKPISWFRVGTTKNRIMVVYATHSRNSTSTSLTFEEPMILHSEKPTTPWRKYAELTIPHYATDLTFFPSSIACITDKGFVIVEPGNSSTHTLPKPPGAGERGDIATLLHSKPMGMFQVENQEFLLVYAWGACYVDGYGRYLRDGSYLRWNVTPAHAIYQRPHLLLMDESKGRIEVRDVTNGRHCEVLEEKGMRLIKTSREDGDVLVKSPRGLLQLVQTHELRAVM